MIKESTEDQAALFARIIADSAKQPASPAQVSEPAAAAVSWNAPSMNMAAAMASLMMGSAAKEESSPTLSSDAIRAAAEFAENKDQLKSLLAEAQRVVAGMQPGPEKSQAQGVIAAASGASPNTIRAVLEALKEMIEQAKSKDATIDSVVAAREQAEAERELRIRQLREQIDGAFDEFEKKGYITKEEKNKLDALDEELDERKKRIDALMAITNRTPEQEQELAQLRQEQKETHRENVNTMRETNANVRTRAQDAGDTQVVERTVENDRNIDAYEAERTKTYDASLFSSRARSETKQGMEHSEASLAENFATPNVPNVKAAMEASQQQTQNPTEPNKASVSQPTEKTTITQTIASDDMLADLGLALAAPPTPINTPPSPKDNNKSIG